MKADVTVQLCKYYLENNILCHFQESRPFRQVDNTLQTGQYCLADKQILADRQADIRVQIGQYYFEDRTLPCRQADRWPPPPP
jgi:hypothetical protein